MKILKPIIAAAFLAGLLGMLLSIAALESGRLDGAAYWVLICTQESGYPLWASSRLKPNWAKKKKNAAE